MRWGKVYSWAQEGVGWQGGVAGKAETCRNMPKQRFSLQFSGYRFARPRLRMRTRISGLALGFDAGKGEGGVDGVIFRFDFGFAFGVSDHNKSFAVAASASACVAACRLSLFVLPAPAYLWSIKTVSKNNNNNHVENPLGGNYGRLTVRARRWQRKCSWTRRTNIEKINKPHPKRPKQG